MAEESMMAVCSLHSVGCIEDSSDVRCFTNLAWCWIRVTSESMSMVSLWHFIWGSKIFFSASLNFSTVRLHTYTYSSHSQTLCFTCACWYSQLLFSIYTECYQRPQSIGIIKRLYKTSWDGRIYTPKNRVYIKCFTPIESITNGMLNIRTCLVESMDRYRARQSEFQQLNKNSCYCS